MSGTVGTPAMQILGPKAGSPHRIVAAKIVARRRGTEPRNSIFTSSEE